MGGATFWAKFSRNVLVALMERDLMLKFASTCNEVTAKKVAQTFGSLKGDRVIK
jgi:hypothetical protein